MSGWESGSLWGEGERWLAPSPTHSDGVVAQEALHAARAVLDGQGLAQVLEGGRHAWVEAVVIFWNTDSGLVGPVASSHHSTGPVGAESSPGLVRISSKY